MRGGRARSRVGQGFVEARLLNQFAGLENLAAVQALDVLGVVILGDETRAIVLAGRIGHNTTLRSCGLIITRDLRALS